MAQERKSIGARIRHVAGGLRKRAFYLTWDPNYLPHGYRPGIMAPSAMVTSPCQLSAMAGIRVLSMGGNAVDAAVATGLADSVINPHLHTLGGEVTILIYLANEQRVVVVDGSTRAPAGATIEFYRGRGIDAIPWDGLLSAGVPGMVDGWLAALDRFGSLSFDQVARPAIELAEQGFPLSASLHDTLVRRRRRFTGEWPASGEVYLRDGEAPPIGSLMANRPLASTLRRLVAAEQQALDAGGDRSAALGAVRDLFYRGDIADAIVRFSQNAGGLLSNEDLAGFSARVEEPLSVDYRGYQVCKAGPWSQGPVLLQALNILEGFDLASMDPDGAQFIHTVVEAEKLAFADREQYYGDPDFVRLPTERLLSKEHAELRRSLIDPRRASMDHRPGDPHHMERLLRPDPEGRSGPMSVRVGTAAEGVARGDTVHFDVVDPQGNVVSATSSGGMILFSPLVEGLGFALGTRLQMFYLDHRHPDGLAPGKRPRTTVSPTLVLRSGLPFASLGSPGGDSQEQATLQALIRLIDFGLPVQAAVELPVFLTRHFPSSFNPHSAVPGSLTMEGRVPTWTEWQLRRRGHRVSVRDWVQTGLLAVQVDPDSGVRTAGVDPRPAILSRMEVGALGY